MQRIRSGLFFARRSVPFQRSSAFPLETTIRSNSNGTTEQEWIWSTASSSANNVREAVKQCCQTLKQKHPQLTQNRDSVVFVWGSQYRTEAARTIPSYIEAEGISQTKHIFGCSTHLGLLGVKSVYRRCALSITVASLPKVKITPFHCASPIVPSVQVDIAKYYDPANTKNTALFMMINRGNGFDEEKFLSRLDVAFPHTPKFGPIWGRRNGEPDIVFVNGDPMLGGAVGLFMEGPFSVKTLHTKGYSPLGAPFTITGGEGTDIWALNSSPSTEALTARLRSFGFAPVNYTPLLAQVIPNTSLPVQKAPVRVLPWSDDKAQIAVGETVQTGDSIQFYYYDYKPVFSNIGEQLENHLKTYSDSSSLGVLGFSSLLDPSSLDELCAPPASNAGDNFNIPFSFPDSNRDLKAAAEQTSETDADSGDDNCIFEQSFDDVDYYEDPDDVKIDLERVLDSANLEVSGPITSSVLIPDENNHSHSVVGSVSFAIFSPDPNYEPKE
jgi:small ligand-binding sensory domain FIST